MVMAAIASTIGTALGSTQGSCLPRAFSIVSFPSISMVCCSFQKRCHRFECHSEVNVLSVAYSALYASAVVC